MSLKAFFLRCSGCAKQYPDHADRFPTPISSTLLYFPNFAAQPCFVACTVINQNSVANAEVLFVIFANLRLAAFEQRMDDFETFVEEEFLPRGDRILIP